MHIWHRKVLADRKFLLTLQPNPSTPEVPLPLQKIELLVFQRKRGQKEQFFADDILTGEALATYNLINNG